VSAFIPALAYISSISNEQNAVVGFIDDHTFTAGEYVSFRVSRPYGMFEINNQRGLVQSITDTTITVDIDTTNYNDFIYPVEGDNTPPVCVPAGSGIIPGSNPSTVSLIDVFDDRPE